MKHLVVSENLEYFLELRFNTSNGTLLSELFEYSNKIDQREYAIK